MANEASTHILYLLATKAIDFDNDAFQIILMESGYTFDEDNDVEYSDVSGSELPTGNGYTAGGETLAGVAVSEVGASNRCTVTWNAVSWTAAGGPIGPSPGAIIYDDTVANDPVIGYIEFDAETTQADGGVLTLNNLEVRISAA